MTSEEVTKQLQANCVFLLEYQLGLLRMQMASLPIDDTARTILNAFPKLIARMIKHSKAFVNLRNVLDYEKAKKAALGLNKINLSLIDQQRQLLEKAGRYSVKGPSNSMVAFATAVLETAVICCSILRSDASIATLHTEGAALLHLLLLRSTTLVGTETMTILDRFASALIGLGLPENKVKILQVTWLMTVLAVLLVSSEEALPYLMAYTPTLAEGLGTAFEEIDEDKERATKSLQDVARSIAVQLSSAAMTISKISDSIVMSLVKDDRKIISVVFRFVTLVGTLAAGHRLLGKVGGSGEEFFAKVTAKEFQNAAEALQEIVDSGLTNLATTAAIEQLKLSELPYQGYELKQQMLNREKPLESLGIRIKDVESASEQVCLLATTLAYTMMQRERERHQIIPSINVIV